MTKREDGGYTFTANPEDFPKKHKAPVINIGIADTGKRRSEGKTRRNSTSYLRNALALPRVTLSSSVTKGLWLWAPLVSQSHSRSPAEAGKTHSLEQNPDLWGPLAQEGSMEI